MRVSGIFRAPRDKVFAVNEDYSDWTRIFLEMRSVGVLRQEDGRIVLEVDDVNRGVINSYRLLSNQTGLREKLVREGWRARQYTDSTRCRRARG